MSAIRQGQVYWIDMGPSDRHPCVVVQNDVFNCSAIATTVVCVITSSRSRAKAPGNVLLKKGEANLPKAGVVNISQLVTLDKADLTECSGTITGASAAAVREGLHLLFDWL